VEVIELGLISGEGEGERRYSGGVGEEEVDGNGGVGR